MKKVWMSVLAAACLVFGAIGMTACGGGKDKHVFSEEWTNDANRHWHVCTAHTDCNQISGTGVHVWGTGEQANTCTVCGYERHAHEFVWEFNESTHKQVATCHPEVEQNVGTHTFTDGTCACGVTQAEVNAYPAYKAYIEALGDEPTPFADWVEMIASENGSLSTNAAGDVTYTHGEDSEIWYAQRTVTASATVDESPLQGVWFKVSAVKTESGGDDAADAAATSASEPQILGTAITGEDGVATISFYPLGYSADGYAYTVEIAGKDETGYGLPYPANSLPLEADAMAIEVTADAATISAAGTATFKKALAPGAIYANAMIGGDTSGGSVAPTSIPLGNVPEGFYELEVTNAQGWVSGPSSTPAVTVYVGSSSKYSAFYYLNVGKQNDDNAREGHYKTILYIPEGTKEIRIKCGTAYDARAYDLALSIAPSTIALGSTNNTFAVTTGFEYPITLPAGAYAITGTTWMGTTKPSSAIKVKIGGVESTLSSGVGSFIVKEGDDKIKFSCGSDSSYYYSEYTITPAPAVTLDTEFTVDLTTGSAVRAITVPEAGVYRITATSDTAFKGLTVKIISDTILNASAEATAHFGSFLADGEKTYVLTFAGAVSAKYKIVKVAAGENVIKANEEKEIVLHPNDAQIYTFSAAAEGPHAIFIKGNGSLKGLTVLNTAQTKLVNCTSAVETFTDFFLLTTGSHELTFRYTGEADLSISVLIVPDDSSSHTLSATSKLDLSFAKRGVQYFTVEDPRGISWTLHFTGDAIDHVKFYKLTVSSTSVTDSTISLTAGEGEKTASATLSATGVIYAIVYDGEGAGTLHIEGKPQLAGPSLTSSIKNNFRKTQVGWSSVTNATGYEIWLKDGEAAIATIPAESSKTSYTWDIPKTYWTKGTHIYVVKAVAENFYPGASADDTRTYESDMGKLTVNIEYPNDYPKGTLTATIYYKKAEGEYSTNDRLGTVSITADGESKIEATNNTFFTETDKSYLLRATTIHAVYGAPDVTFESASFAEKEGTATLTVTEKNNCVVTVNITVPEGNADQTGSLKISSLTVELWKGDEKYTPAVSSGTVSGLATAENEGKGKATFTVLESGDYTVKITNLYKAYAYDEQTVNISLDSDTVRSTKEVNITITKKNANTVSIALPDGLDLSGTITIDAWQGEASKGTESVTVSVGAKSASVIFYGLADGTYTLKMTLDSTLLAHYSESDEGTLTITSGESEAVTLTVKEKTKSVITVAGFAGGGVKLSLWKEGDDDRAVYDSGYVAITSTSKTYTFYGIDAGEYVVKIAIVGSENRTYRYSFDHVTLTATAEAGGNATITVTETEKTTVSFSFPESISSGQVTVNVYKSDDLETMVDTMKVPVNATGDPSTKTADIYLPEASGTYVIKTEALDVKYFIHFLASETTINVTGRKTTDAVTVQADGTKKVWTITYKVNNDTYDGKKLDFFFYTDSMGSHQYSGTYCATIHGNKAIAKLYDLENGGLAKMMPAASTYHLPAGATVNWEGIKLSNPATTTNWDVEIGAPDPNVGKKISVWTSFGGFSSSYYGTLTFVWVDTTQNDKVIGNKEWTYEVTKDSSGEFTLNWEFPSTYATTSECKKMKLKLKSAKKADGTDFTDKVQLGENKSTLTGYSQAISQRFDMSWQTWLYFTIKAD